MYLNIGKNYILRKDTVIGIFDLDNSSYSHITRKFLSCAEKAGQVINAAEDLPKSFILCLEDGEQRIYLSQLSYQTLLKRSALSDTEAIFKEKDNV